MEWLHPFAALALCCGAVLQLLPQGSIRRTAALVIGLLLTLCWADAVGQLIGREFSPDMSDSMLAPTGYVMETATPAGGDPHAAGTHP